MPWIDDDRRKCPAGGRGGRMPRAAAFACLLSLAALAAGCYHDMTAGGGISWIYPDEEPADTAWESPQVSRHYSISYNFVVRADSMPLLRQQPEGAVSGMRVDTVWVYRHERIAVADIRAVPNDTVDSVWVQVARDQDTFGWVHESGLLSSVVPSDPISQFISVFSDRHLLVFLIVISVISVAYLLRTLRRRNARMVHLNDINSFYPTLLALVVALSATLYASIQSFDPQAWQHFYYHPTLNPFVLPPVLSIFMMSVWAMLIIAIAVVDVVRTMLPAWDALLYLCGLAGVCAIAYIVFSVTTLYYVGYPLFVAYCAWAVRAYVRRSGASYFCGNCGTRLEGKGRCPSCGAENE